MSNSKFSVERTETGSYCVVHTESRWVVATGLTWVDATALAAEMREGKPTDL